MKLADVTESLIDGLILVNAARYETKPEHWIGGDDESLSYCRKCAEKEIRKLQKGKPKDTYFLDGGRGCESDGQPFCETCGDALAASFTTYACESELDHFEDYGIDLDSPGDCYSMERIMGSVGFLDDELTPRIKRVIAKAVRARDRKAKRLASGK